MSRLNISSMTCLTLSNELKSSSVKFSRYRLLGKAVVNPDTNLISPAEKDDDAGKIGEAVLSEEENLNTTSIETKLGLSRLCSLSFPSPFQGVMAAGKRGKSEHKTQP